MFAQLAHEEEFRQERRSAARPGAAVLLGAGLGLLLTYLWPDLPVLAAMALWPLSLGVSSIFVALYSFRVHRQPCWGLGFFGQLVGMVAVGLFLAATVL